MKRLLARLLLPFAALGALGLAAVAGSGRATPPPELGRVAWQRNLEGGLEQARAADKPLFLLFQEVPGCRTCVSFGEQVLSHPLLVEAIESEFVPVVIYNNRGGQDREVLERFDEPAWNNPVVRLLAPDGRDLVPRRGRIWSPHGVGERMIAALRAHAAPVPAYLAAAVDELRPRTPEYATFGMHCFWSGEACLGEIPGILTSRAGFLGGREVVEVTFDPAVLSYAELLRAARRAGCSDEVFVRNDAQERAARALFGNRVRRTQAIARSAPAEDQKRALRGTRFAKLDLTPWQAVQVNAAVAAKRSPARLLSPRQRAQVGLAMDAPDDASDFTRADLVPDGGRIEVQGRAARSLSSSNNGEELGMSEPHSAIGEYERITTVIDHRFRGHGEARTRRLDR